MHGCRVLDFKSNCAIIKKKNLSAYKWQDKIILLNTPLPQCVSESSIDL